MGMFMAVSVTAIVVLLALMAGVVYKTIIFRGLVVFFIFGLLGAILGSFLEIVLMPVIDDYEDEKLRTELVFSDDHLVEQLGDLLEDAPQKSRFVFWAAPKEKPPNSVTD